MTTQILAILPLRGRPEILRSLAIRDTVKKISLSVFSAKICVLLKFEEEIDLVQLAKNTPLRR